MVDDSEAGPNLFVPAGPLGHSPGEALVLKNPPGSQQNLVGSPGPGNGALTKQGTGGLLRRPGPALDAGSATVRRWRVGGLDGAKNFEGPGWLIAEEFEKGLPGKWVGVMIGLPFGVVSIGRTGRPRGAPWLDGVAC